MLRMDINLNIIWYIGIMKNIRVCLSSTSYINNERITNTKNLRKYLNGEYLDTSVYEDKDIRMENEIMLGLRKLDGIDLDRFKEKFNVSLEDIYNIDNLVMKDI